MENVSEKKPRGRPRLTPEWWDDAPKHMVIGDAKSRRSSVNHYYKQLAFNQIGEDNRFGWLFDRGGDLPQTILFELGRVYAEFGQQTLELAADLICEQKPTAREAVERIRYWRKEWAADRTPERKPPGDPDKLADALDRLIEDYKKRFPRIGPDEVLEALDNVRDRWDFIF